MNLLYDVKGFSLVFCLLIDQDEKKIEPPFVLVIEKNLDL